MKKRHKGSTQSVYHVVNTSTVDWRRADSAQHAVNALVIANQSTWDMEFDRLMEQVHQLHLMPHNLKCVLALYAASGFIRQPGIKDRVTVRDVIDYMNKNCHDGQVALVKASQKDLFMAIVPGGYSKYDPNQDCKDGYHCYGIHAYPDCDISDIWIRWADGQDHSPVKRRKGRAAKEKKFTVRPDHETFHYLQKNPTERTKDCVIRAFAAILDISWDEALDRITAASGKENTTINIPNVYHQLLKQEGFSPRPPMKVKGRMLTGKEFCRELDKVLLNGERVFAYLRRNHVAAVLPFVDHGETHYKIVDCWDSTDRPVVEYWIKGPALQEEVMPTEDVIPVGAYVTHPLLGRGKVQSVHSSGWVEIDFPRGGPGMFDCKWIKRNCEIEDAPSV